MSLTDPREERRLLGRTALIGRIPGGIEISTGKAPRERRGGLACTIAKWKTGGIGCRKSDLDKAKMAKIDTSKIAESIENSGYHKI